MADESPTPTARSRRALLAAAIGGAAALAAERLAGPTAVAAANNDPLLVGRVDNAASAPTLLSHSGATSVGLAVASQGDLALAGSAQRTGTAWGIAGAAKNGIGAKGLEGDVAFDPYADTSSAAHFGVYGFSGTPGGIGVYGQTAVNGGTTGVQGSGDRGGFFLGTAVGALVQAYDDPGAVGSTARSALHAHVAASGDGVPTAPAGTAVFASVDNPATRFGLQVQGRVRLVDRAGRVTVRAGRAKVTKTVAGVTSANVAVAMLNASRSGVHVRAVVCSTNAITIYLNKAVGSATPVSWIVLG